jgi:hypothetical protein
MPRKMSPLFIIILALVGIGLLADSINNPAQIIIPVAVFGLIFLMYKYPPGSVRSRPKAKPQQRGETMQGKPRTRKNMPFRVIEGGKDDDNLPKYH